MINTTTTISAVLEELPYPTSNDLSNELVPVTSGVVGTVFTTIPISNHFTVGIFVQTPLENTVTFSGVDQDSQIIGNTTAKGTLFATNLQVLQFIIQPAFVQSLQSVPYTPSANDADSQIYAPARTTTVFSPLNDTETFAPSIPILQTLVDTTIGNSIQVVQAAPIRQTWG